VAGPALDAKARLTVPLNRETVPLVVVVGVDDEVSRQALAYPRFVCAELGRGAAEEIPSADAIVRLSWVKGEQPGPAGRPRRFLRAPMLNLV
jgi:hypothetical protein